MVELLEGIGHNIRRLRAEKGWNQTELGFRADTSPSIISLIENGKRNPSTATLAKIAGALGVEVVELFPKASSRSSLEPTLLNGLDERRESKLPEVADLLLGFGETLLLTWEAELPDRARADDAEWLANIAVLWRGFGLINYGVLEELGAEGVRDKQGWLARYMDINAAVHRINAAIREYSAAVTSPDEEAAVTLAPLAAEVT